MKKATKIATKSELLKRPSKVKASRKSGSPIRMEDAPFFKKKMAKGEKILAIAGLPK